MGTDHTPGTICGKDGCGQHHTAESAAGLNANLAAGITGGGPTLREWITAHLGLYLPGAIGPSAWDIALTACAGKDTVETTLKALQAEGLVEQRTPGVAKGEIRPRGSVTRWTLTESGWSAVHEALAAKRAREAGRG